MVIKAERAELVERLVRAWGPARCAMLSLTIRHGAGNRLKPTRVALAKSWNHFLRRRPVRALFDDVGLVGWLRAFEVTHGQEHGWHPHYHIMLLVERPEVLAAAAAQLAALWLDQVTRTMGEGYSPTLERGAVLTPVTDGKYLCKLGLELEAPGTKGAKNGNRTPWEIAQDFKDHGDDQDLALWHDYTRSVLGAKQLQSSDGLWDLVNEEPRSDEEIVEDCRSGEEVLATIQWEAWRELVANRPGAGRDYELLLVAEKGGQSAVDACLQTWAKRDRGTGSGTG